MIIEIENNEGKQLGALLITENDINGNLVIRNSILKNISVADIDGDDIFNTNEPKIRIQIEDNKL